MLQNITLDMLFILLLFQLVYSGYSADQAVLDWLKCEHECNSQIYCRGEILHDIQLSGFFADEHTFVNHSLRDSEENILAKYKKLKEEYNGVPAAPVLGKFIEENFVNYTLPEVDFPDFNPNPGILDKIKKTEYKDWIKDLNNRWKQLGTKLPDEVKTLPSRHSYLWVPNAYINAGGRYAGMYYWDSYWIIKGLLLSGMHDTAKGIIENMTWLVKKYGHVPYANRVYFKTRAQPPMLIQMANAYYQVTKNETFLKANLKLFDKEFQWWKDHRQITVVKNQNTYSMFTYKSVGCDPRPEYYRMDYNDIKDCKRKDVLKTLTGRRAAAESGWDFSSRHMRGENDSNLGSLQDADPASMVPVDLNSLMHSNARIMKEWHKTVKNNLAAERYEIMEKNLYQAIDKSEASLVAKLNYEANTEHKFPPLIESVPAKYAKSVGGDNVQREIKKKKLFWNNEVGVWLDYDLVTNSSRNYFYLSNFVPLWTKSFKNTEYVEKVINYLISQEIINSDLNTEYYCVPTSTYSTGERWDMPNCWPPLQAFLIQGLQQYSNENPKAGKIAFNLAQKWIQTTYKGYQQTGQMFEKYSALDSGQPGVGGVYESQTGFGWTNGVCMEMLDTYGSNLQ